MKIVIVIGYSIFNYSKWCAGLFLYLLIYDSICISHFRDLFIHKSDFLIHVNQQKKIKIAEFLTVHEISWYVLKL